MSEHTTEKDAGHGKNCDGCLMLAMVERAERAEAALARLGIEPRVIEGQVTPTSWATANWSASSSSTSQTTGTCTAVVAPPAERVCSCVSPMPRVTQLERRQGGRGGDE